MSECIVNCAQIVKIVVDGKGGSKATSSRHHLSHKNLPNSWTSLDPTVGTARSMSAKDHLTSGNEHIQKRKGIMINTDRHLVSCHTSMRCRFAERITHTFAEILRCRSHARRVAFCAIVIISSGPVSLLLLYACQTDPGDQRCKLPSSPFSARISIQENYDGDHEERRESCIDSLCISGPSPPRHWQPPRGSRMLRIFQLSSRF